MRAPLSSLSLVVALALSSTSALAAERVAVLEFTAEDGAASESILRQISDEARRAAVDVLPTSHYSVITRENQETILREQDVDPAAMCDAQCEVDLARTIGASLLVTGNVAKIGARHILNIKVFHADRGQVLKIVKVQAQDEGELYDQTYGAARGMLRDGLGLTVDDEAPARSPVVVDTAPSTSQARVSFDSSPRGATVFVDGVKVCDVTPCTADVPRRQVTVRMTAIDHLPADERVKPLDGLFVTLALKPAFALVRVRIDPPGLPLFVDGRPVDASGGAIKLEQGSYTFSTGDGCHEPASEKLSVTRGQSYDVTLRAERTRARLRVEASIDDGTPLFVPVFVDGEQLGETGREFTVWACASQVRASGPEGLERSAALSLSKSGVTTVRMVWSRAELDGIEAARRQRAESEKLAALEAEAEAARQREAAREAARIQAFDDTAIFVWNLGALALMIGGGGLMGLVGLASSPLSSLIGMSQPLPPPSAMVGLSSDNDLAGVIDIAVPTLAIVGAIMITAFGITMLFTSDLSAAPVWPTDICYGPCACGTRPLVPDACLGVE